LNGEVDDTLEEWRTDSAQSDRDFSDLPRVAPGDEARVAVIIKFFRARPQRHQGNVAMRVSSA